MDELMELLDDFLVESFEMIEEMDNDLIELENNPDDLELINKIFRVAHTIKGSGSFLNFNKLTHLTHHMEAVLDKARKGELKRTPEIMDVILESIDAMKAILEYIRDNKSDESPDVDIEPIVKKLDFIVNGTFGSGEENKAEEKKGINLDEITLDNVDELDLESLPPEELDAILEKLVDEVNKPTENTDKLNEEEKEPQDNNKQNESSKNSVEIKKEEKPVKSENKQEVTKKDIKKQIANVKEQTIRVDVKRLD